MGRIAWKRSARGVAAIAVAGLLPMALGVQARVAGAPQSVHIAASNLLLFIVWTIVSLALHELGHAAVARIVGLRVSEIRIGSGLPLLEFRIAKARLRIGSVPTHGLVTAVATKPSRARTRRWLSVLAGPAVNLLLFIGATRVHPLTSDALVQSTRVLLPLQTFAYANLILLVWSLIPRKTPRGTSDGLRLLAIPLINKPTLPELLATSHVIDLMEMLRDGDLESAKQAAEALLTRSPESVSVLSLLGVVLVRQRSPSDARARFRQALARVPSNSVRRWSLLNNIAWCSLMIGDQESMLEANDLSRKVLRAVPKQPWANGTRGSVLVARQRYEEGRALLRWALENHDEQESRASNAAWLAIAEHGLGNEPRAKRYLELARRLDPKCDSLDRAESALRIPGAPPSPACSGDDGA